MTSMLDIPFDAFCCIASLRATLTPVDLIAILLSCKRTVIWMTKYIADSGVLAEGYPGRPTLIATFTCYCGRFGWRIRSQCKCFVMCDGCTRKLPVALAAHIQDSPLYCCGFPCETRCTYCDCEMAISWKNTVNFEFVAGSLRCEFHSFAPVYNSYKWSQNKKIRCGIPLNVLPVADNGPILWNLIARYDPDHPLLTFRPS